MAERKTKASRPFAFIGFSLGLTYLLLVVVVYAYTAVTTDVYKAGYDWIPFILLTLPWCRWGIWFVVPGVLINALLLYGMSRLMQSIWDRFTLSSAD